MPAPIKSACCINLRKSQGSCWQPTSSNQHECGKVEGLAEESPWGTGTWIHCHLTAAWGGSVLSVLNPNENENSISCHVDWLRFLTCQFCPLTFRCHTFYFIMEKINNWHQKWIYPWWFVFLCTQCFQKEPLPESKLASPTMPIGAQGITLTLQSYFSYQGILSCRRLSEELWEIGRGSSGMKTREAKSVGARPSSNGNSHSPFRPMKTSVYAKHSGEGFPHGITQQESLDANPGCSMYPPRISSTARNTMGK